jgi:hypothetical protein
MVGEASSGSASPEARSPGRCRLTGIGAAYPLLQNPGRCSPERARVFLTLGVHRVSITSRDRTERRARRRRNSDVRVSLPSAASRRRLPSAARWRAADTSFRPRRASLAASTSLQALPIAAMRNHGAAAVRVGLERGAVPKEAERVVVAASQTNHDFIRPLCF